MANEDMMQEYQKVFDKLLELRNLLANMLLRFGAINEDNGQCFFELLAHLENINSTTQYVSPLDIDTSFKHFSDNDNDKVFYDGDFYIQNPQTEERTNMSIRSLNVLLAQKINSYRAYLRDYLLNVGVPRDIVYQEITLKWLIQCLYQIERVKNTFIVFNSNILYVNMENELDYDIVDDGNDVLIERTVIINEEAITLGIGTMIIRENNDIIYNGPAIGATITPTTLGEHTYTFEFTPEDSEHYNGTTLTQTLFVQKPKIKLNVSIENTNEESVYYESENEGYYEDTWNIAIITTDMLDNIISNTPIKIYIGNTIINQGNTNILGEYVYTGQIPYYSSDFEDYIVPIRIQTDRIGDSYINDIYSAELTIYHHILEADNEWYIGQQDGVKIYLCDELTGEHITTVTSYEVEYELDENGNYVLDENGDPIIISEIVQEINHPLRWQPICVNNSCVFPTDNVWEYNIDTTEKGIYQLHIIDPRGEYVNEYQNVEVKSNFILPETDIIYLPESNLPKIYYKPLGEICEQGNVNVQFTKYYEHNHQYSTHTGSCTVTNSEIKNYFYRFFGGYAPAQYYITFTSNPEDNINESVTFSFVLKEPLQLIQTSYNKSACATYELKVYDKETLDKMEGHLIGDGYEEFNVEGPNEVTIEFLNDGYSLISLYSANTNIANIGIERNAITIDQEQPHTYNKSNTSWQKINIKIDDDYKIYANDVLLKTINQTYGTLQIYVMSMTGYYRNVDIKNRYTPITVTNNGNNVDYTYTKVETFDYYLYTINICRDGSNDGDNIITATINGYTESDTFELRNQTFQLLTTDFIVGNNNIQIKSFDPNVTNITIIHNNITQNSITKDGDIFTINCDIYEAGSLHILLEDNQHSQEPFTINVGKKEYTINLNMPEIKEYKDFSPIPLSIQNAFGQEINTFYVWFDNQTALSMTKTGTNISLTNTAIGQQFDSLDMGEHTIHIRVSGDPNYIDQEISQTFLIGVYISSLTNQPLFTDLNMDNDGWLSNESMSVDNQTTIGDLEDVLVGINTTVNVDPGQLVLSNFVSSDIDLNSIVLLDDDFHNIQNAIINIDVEDDKLTYDTIEDDENL